MEQIRGVTPAIAAAVGILLAGALSLGLSWPGAARAADDPLPPDPPQSVDPQPEAQTPQSVEVMLDELAAAANETDAKALERRIVAAWNRSGSDTVDLLVARAGAAVSDKKFGVALEYLDTIVALKPDFVEGWNMRATVYYLIDEYELSLSDIRHVLSLQPRHFGALSGLGMIFRELEQPQKALEAFRKVLTVHPYFGTAKDSAEKLKIEVEGRDT